MGAARQRVYARDTQGRRRADRGSAEAPSTRTPQSAKESKLFSKSVS